MDILKLLLIFLVIILVLWLHKPLSLAIVAATLVIWPLYGLAPQTVLESVIRGAIGWDTIQLLLVLYLITFLQRMLEKRGCLSNAKEALDGLFHSRRVDASVAPALLGMLPAVGTVLICGDIVRQTTDGFLTREKCGRAYRLDLSEKGQQAFAVSHQVFFDWDRQVLDPLTSEERTQLLSLLSKAAQKEADQTCTTSSAVQSTTED